jgi:hypothetical protein
LQSLNLEDCTSGAKRGKPNGEERAASINTREGEQTTPRTRSKGTTLIINIASHLQLGFPIHEAIVIERPVVVPV